MAAHTFELSPTWAPDRPPVSPSLVARPKPQITDFDQPSATSSRRIAAVWILLPAAAVLAGLAALFIPSADNAATHHSAAPPTVAEPSQALNS
jgi:hypothetical protein